MRRFAAIVIPLFAVLLLALWRANGPAPKPPNAPAGEFSSDRAMGMLRELLGDETPHPAGTDRVRERVISRFRALGYETTVQTTIACNALPSCAAVSNIFAKPAGAKGRAVLLVAHHDSVGAGPGASDDGVGVAAILEIARALRGQSHRNPIEFLITDAEESGLVGAEAFVGDPALVRNAGVVINVENRGTYGPSNMFETSSRNRWLIRRFARGVGRPHATSFFSAIYNLLPNDTDVTVFKRAGIPALNFAAIRGVNWYHTPLDNLAHVNPRTLQHHGDNLLGAARALADSDLDARSSDDASYFDVLQFALVWWPAGWTVWICAISLVLLLFAARHTNPRAITFGVLATFTAILLSLIAGIALSWLARMRSDGVNFVAHPQPSILAMWLIGIAAAICAAALFRKRSEERALLFGAAFVWHAIAFVLAITLTGASFLFLVPAVALTICALARANETTTSAVSATAAAIVLLPLLILLYDALGGRMLVAIAILAGILFTLVGPLFARFRNAAVFAALALVAAIVALALPATSRERPRAISLAYIDDATLSPMFVAPVRMANFTAAPASLTPWSSGAQWSTPAPRLAIRRVEMTTARNGDRVTLTIRSPRHGNRLTLALRGGTVLRVNGITPPPRPARWRERSETWRFALMNGRDQMTVEVQAKGALEAIASDVSFGLDAPALQRARDASNAVPQGEGDVVITRTRLRL
ncbi:MAG TPA: M20/M25/M40 family metallo-hydrolase [Thermoanaerobaculia bacterium]|nr:M20/M25/M40 family metallo-hydrolase [Thermoanaerobaculia bacterium]